MIRKDLHYAHPKPTNGWLGLTIPPNRHDLTRIIWGSAMHPGAPVSGLAIALVSTVAYAHNRKCRNRAVMFDRRGVLHKGRLRLLSRKLLDEA